MRDDRSQDAEEAKISKYKERYESSIMTIQLLMVRTLHHCNVDIEKGEIVVFIQLRGLSYLIFRN